MSSIPPPTPNPRLTNTQESLESSLLDKENTLAKTSEKLELISSLGESLSQKEFQLREVSEKLLQTELSVSGSLLPSSPPLFPPRAVLQLCAPSPVQLEKVSQEGNRSEKQCSELRTEVADLTHKLSALKEKVSVLEEMAKSTSHNEAKKILHEIKGNCSLLICHTEKTEKTLLQCSMDGGLGGISSSQYC